MRKEQILDWMDNPVTLKFLGLCEQEVEELNSVKGPDAYHPYEPQKTQEVMANLNGAIEALDRVIASLVGEENDEGERELSGFFIGEAEDEQVRD